MMLRAELDNMKECALKENKPVTRVLNIICRNVIERR